MARYDFLCPACGSAEERAVPITRAGLVAEQRCGCGAIMERKITHEFRFQIEGGGAAVEAAGRNTPRSQKIKRQIAKRRYKE